MGGKGGMGGGMGGMRGMQSNGMKESLVNAIKTYQRGGDENKQNWGNFCTERLNDVRDPARHDANVLQSFCDMFGIPTGGGGGYGGGGGGGSPRGGGYGGAPMDGAKAELVNRIKNFQKASPAQKEAWYEFCGDIKDPA